MAQKTFVSEILTASDVNTFLAGEGGAWTTWTPTVTQSGAVTVTNTRSRFARYGRTIHFSCDLTVTGSGTAGNAILISLPVTAAASSTIPGGMPMGEGAVYDDSGVAVFRGQAALISTTSMQILSGATDFLSALGVSGFTLALASPDRIAITGSYEAAS